VDHTDLSIAADGTEYTIPSTEAVRAAYDEIASEVERQRRRGRQIVVVQGLGFVGSAVAAAIAAATDVAGAPKFFVIGIDLPTPACYWKVAKINSGQVPISSPDRELDRLIRVAACESRNLVASTCQQVYGLADVIVIDVPLSVKERVIEDYQEVHIESRGFEHAVETVGRHMREDALVLVETTVPAGTCERVALPILEEQRRKRGLNSRVYLAHAYERVMPGPRYVESIRRFWRSFAGIDQPSAERARAFLEAFIETDDFPLCQLADTTSSELGKLLENTYRAVNIALIHEWTLLAEKMNVNLFEVIDGIRVRKGTHDNIRFPGFGVGGYCLTKDSLLAQWAADNLYHADVNLELTLHSLRVNYHMPRHTCDLIVEGAGGSLAGTTVTVCGVAYLANVADSRNSPTEYLVRLLHETGANVLVHDPCINVWDEMPTVEVKKDLNECLRCSQGVVLAVPHAEYVELSAADLCSHELTFVVDAQNIINDSTADQLWRSGLCVLGVGKGHWRKRGYQWLPQQRTAAA
jgi:nucleotide sugar dehydrogenase